MRSDRSRVAWCKSRRAGHEERILSKQKGTCKINLDSFDRQIHPVRRTGWICLYILLSIFNSL